MFPLYTPQASHLMISLRDWAIVQFKTRTPKRLNSSVSVIDLKHRKTAFGKAKVSLVNDPFSTTRE